METETAHPTESYEEQLPEGELPGMEPGPVEPDVVRCSKSTVIQTVDSLEDGALNSFRDGGITKDDLRVVMHAAEKARRALADGKEDPCRVVSDMARDMIQGDPDGF